MAVPQWKLDLQPATYNGVLFFVDVNTRASGRRIANHEYPKRDIPYAEDMGRKSRRFSVTGYVIGPTYPEQRDALIEQLETDGPGMLTLPTGLERVGSNQVSIENYSVSERRERGGIATFEMAFLEFGVNTSTIQNPDTQGQTSSAVSTATADNFVNAPDLSTTSGSSTFDSAQTFMNTGGVNGVPSAIQFTNISGNTTNVFGGAQGSFGAPSFMQSSDITGLGTFNP